MKHINIYEIALKRIVRLMYDHDPLSGNHKPDGDLIEEACNIAGEALLYLRGVSDEPDWLIDWGLKEKLVDVIRSHQIGEE